MNPENATGVELIAQERERQIEIEGYTREHDHEHKACELALAAVCYAIPHLVRRELSGKGNEWVARFWPWSPESFKPTPGDRIRELVKAGALIAADIDRLKRMAIAGEPPYDFSDPGLSDE